MPHAVQPTLQALLVADRIYVDRDSGKRIIAGVFQRLFVMRGVADFEQAQKSERVRRQGAVAGSPFGYASLTDVDGKQIFNLRYVRLADDQVIFEAELTASSSDRLSHVEFSVPLPPLPTSPLGVYALELLWESVPLGSYRIIVAELDEPKHDDN